MPAPSRLAVAAIVWSCAAGPAMADEPARPVELSASYVADVDGVTEGPVHGARFVDLLRIDATANLEAAPGWKGGKIVATFEAGTGSQPNQLAGTLEGIDNAETTLNRPRLFQAYLQQDLAAAASVKLGFVDLNSDFYSTDSSSLLLAPPFGIGSELAASGPNGPSIFPSTAPTIALRLTPIRDVYLQAAAINAEARVIGDPGGPALLLREGALLIAEAGWMGVGGSHSGGKLALGGWVYTRGQDDQRDVDAAGDPLRRKAWGAYALYEQPLGEHATAFLRGGVSDADTTPFAGSVQAGVLLSQVIAGRPESRLSAGFHAGFLAPKYRANLADAGEPQKATELGWELTYEDQLTSWLTIQPDLQYIRNAPRLTGSGDVAMVALRLTFTAPGMD